MVVFIYHDDVIKWKHFPRYWTFVRGIHRLPQQHVLLNITVARFALEIVRLLCSLTGVYGSTIGIQDIANTPGSTFIRHRSDTCASDRYLIDTDPRVFAIGDCEWTNGICEHDVDFTKMTANLMHTGARWQRPLQEAPTRWENFVVRYFGWMFPRWWRQGVLNPGNSTVCSKAYHTKNKVIIKVHFTCPLCCNPTATGGFPTQRVNNAGNASMSRCHSPWSDLIDGQINAETPSSAQSCLKIFIYDRL